LGFPSLFLFFSPSIHLSSLVFWRFCWASQYHSQGFLLYLVLWQKLDVATLNVFVLKHTWWFRRVSSIFLDLLTWLLPLKTCIFNLFCYLLRLESHAIFLFVHFCRFPGWWRCKHQYTWKWLIVIPNSKKRVPVYHLLGVEKCSDCFAQNLIIRNSTLMT
jgi:hypothetical protein